MPNSNGTIKRTSPSTADLQKQVQALSTLTARLSLASKLGVTHAGDRDLYKTLGYPTSVDSTSLIQQWTRQDIARAIVDRPVKATWQGEVTVSEASEEEDTELEKAYKTLDNELGLKTKFMRVDRLSQLGKYAVMLLGFDDSAQETWAQPVTAGERKLRYVRVVSEKNAEISTWEKDPADPRYGLPRLYKIKLKKPGQQMEQAIDLTVHYSRIIHVAPDLLEDDVESVPIMKTAYNRLKDLEKLVGGSAEMFWRGARPGYSGKAEEGYKIGDDVKADLQEQIKEYEHDLRRFLVTEGVDLQSLAQQIADPKGHVEVQMMMLSALTQIPMRILMGSERGELASAMDDQTWKEYLESRRLEIVEPGIVRPFVDRMIQYEVLPEIKDEEEGYQITWMDLFTLGEKDKAEVGSQRSTALAQYVKDGVEMTVPLEGFLRYVMRMDEDEITHMLELREGFMDELMEEENELERVLAAPSETEPAPPEPPPQT